MSEDARAQLVTWVGLAAPSGRASSLTECEAKRRIVEPHVDGHRCEWGDWYMAGECEAKVLRFLALPYANHPDYSDEWLP